MEPVNPYIVVHSGEQFDLIAPTPDMVDLDDIARALARQPRWNGHTKLPYNVAQHSVNVSRLVEDITFGDYKSALAGLLHDAHEAYIGDIATPVKKALIHYGCPPSVLEKLASNIDEAIFPQFGLPPVLPAKMKQAVKEADSLATATEYKIHMPDGSPKVARFEATPMPRYVEVQPLDEMASFHYFIERFVQLRTAVRLQEAA